MRLLTFRAESGYMVGRVEGDGVVEVCAGDVAQLLREPDWQERAGNAEGSTHALGSLSLAPLVVTPAKILCIGANYWAHIAELKRAPSEYPSVFAKFARSLTGANDPIIIPRVSQEVDYEAEVGLVIGRGGRYLRPEDASAAVAGLTVVNDVSMRDWQHRTAQVTQGKIFDRSCPVGPVLVTLDELPLGSDLELRCEVDGTVVQRTRTSDMIFDPAFLVSYCSSFTTLEPGDLISTGTPGGVGVFRDPPSFLRPGQVVRTVLEHVGELRNTCEAEAEPIVEQ
jgi:acylpyruvate hydrolase